MVNPYTGRNYAIRYFSFLMLDNSKITGAASTAVSPAGRAGRGTWDIDNDGVAEGYIYHEMTHTLGLDLAKRTSKTTGSRAASSAETRRS